MKKTLNTLMFLLFLLAAFALPAFAITEAEVQAQVAASSKEAVSGNLFIWFLCAVAFLKVSQKIDSFMGSLGVNVGHTGGNLLAEAMVAARGIQMGKQALGSGSGGFGKAGGTGKTGPSGSSGGGSTRFLQGGLAGAASRQFTKSATHSATNQGGNMITSNAFKTSMAKGGDFANSIISNVAQGDIRQMGSITGETASQAVVSYMGLTGKPGAPTYTNAEIGGGRIMGVETSGDSPDGMQFGMYHAEQYMAPEQGSYDVVQSVDGVKWYRQYAVDAVEKIPYEKPDGKVAYDESIVQKLPPVPRRKDRV